MIDRALNIERDFAYVLITPARNEASFIEQTIKSVIAQTIHPLKWIIVSDGSTDGTDDIVKRYADKYDWIELVCTPKRKDRHFAGKVYAFNAGYEVVKGLEFDIVGSLDADITFDNEYFEFLLDKFALYPKLGVAGTPFKEKNLSYDYRFTSIEHVSGACQLFRRSCFEEIGGYIPLKVGGIDLVAVTTARMKGWRTRTFTQKYCDHHREIGTAEKDVLKATFNRGYHDYLMGVHPLWQLFRSSYQTTRRPVLLGGLLLFTGYLWAMLKRAEQPVPADFIRFRKKEHLRRLKQQVASICLDPIVYVLRRFRKFFWIYPCKDFIVRDSSDFKMVEPQSRCDFIQITFDNYSDVRDFREEERVEQYRKKLADHEIGFFAVHDGKVVGSIWAIINNGNGPCVVRTFIDLQQNEALICDIVVSPGARGMSIGPFLLSKMITVLLSEYRVSGIITDVNVKNKNSLRMMSKTGLKLNALMFYSSILNKRVLALKVRRYR